MCVEGWGEGRLQYTCDVLDKSLIRLRAYREEAGLWGLLVQCLAAVA